MKVYDEKLYEYLSQKENFEPYFDLHQQYEKVRSQLVNDFWKVVESNVSSLLNNPKDGWNVSLDAPNTPSRKLRMNYPAISAPQFRAGIIYENVDSYVYRGMWINRGLLKDDNSFKQICDSAQLMLGTETKWKVGSGGWWFAIYQDTGKNLKEKNTLMQVLPTERAALAQTLAEDLVQAVDELGNFCIEQVSKHAWK